MALLYADWSSEGAIRLNRALTLDDLSGCLVLKHARLVMQSIGSGKGVGLTATGNFSRKFVEQMVEAFQWPGYEPAAVWYLNKVLNEPDFPPLHFIHALFDVVRLGRKYKGTYRLSRAGRALLEEDTAGDLNALLFEAAFNRYSLAYLDRRSAHDSFQNQNGLTLYLIQRVADQRYSADELYEMTTLPVESERPGFPDHAAIAFRFGFLRYLEWFGLLEAEPIAANQDWSRHERFRKTALFDRFLSFHLDASR